MTSEYLLNYDLEFCCSWHLHYFGDNLSSLLSFLLRLVYLVQRFVFVELRVCKFSKLRRLIFLVYMLRILLQVVPVLYILSLIFFCFVLRLLCLLPLFLVITYFRLFFLQFSAGVLCCTSN